jgi:hypothetical protein
MPGYTQAAQAAAKPSPLQLAIREWQRQLIEKQK